MDGCGSGYPQDPKSLWKTTQAQVGGPAWSMISRREIKTSKDSVPAPWTYTPQRLMLSFLFLFFIFYFLFFMFVYSFTLYLHIFLFFCEKKISFLDHGYSIKIRSGVKR